MGMTMCFLGMLGMLSAALDASKVQPGVQGVFVSVLAS